MAINLSGVPVTSVVIKRRVREMLTSKRTVVSRVQFREQEANLVNLPVQTWHLGVVIFIQENVIIRAPRKLVVLPVNDVVSRHPLVTMVTKYHGVNQSIAALPLSIVAKLAADKCRII
jgi:hypothetical protein